MAGGGLRMPKKKGGSKGKSAKARLEAEEALKKEKGPEIEARFKQLFEVYSVAESGEEGDVIAEEDFGHFVRSLGLFATNAQVAELLAKVKEGQGEGQLIHGAKLREVLAPVVLDAMLNPASVYAPPTEEQLLAALQAMDLERKGHLTETDFRNLMSSYGEKLEAEEMEHAVDEAVNPASGVVDLDRYVCRLAYNSPIL